MSGRRRHERATTEAEAELWRRAVADAAPLRGAARVPLSSPRRTEPAHEHKLNHVHRAATTVPHIASEPSTLSTGKPASKPLDRATLARLKKGRMPIEGRIDLHGMTAAAAERNLAAFLRSSQAAGKRAVLVITGRGLDPQNLGRGVLKRETPHWLNRHPDIVAGYNEADRRHGGAGALYVRLRRKDKAQRS